MLWTLIVVGSLTVLWSRLGGLSLGLWHDEIYTVVHYVEPGPEAVFFGDYVPNNHMLFSLLAWTTTATAGTTEVGLRFWSVVPALLIVALTFRWLWTTVGLSVATSFLVLVAVHPLLLIISPQARGYGLAMCLVSLTIGSAWFALSEAAERTALIWVGVAATLAILTVPVAVIPFLMLVPLLWVRHRWAAIWLAGGVGLVSLSWYAGNLVDLVRNVGQDFGAVLPWHAPLTGPFKVGLFPIVRFVGSGEASEFSSDLLTTRFAVVAVVLGAVLAVFGVRRFARYGSTLQAAALWVPVFGTYLVLTVARVGVADRFVSFLVIPILALLSAGLVEVAGHARQSVWARGLLAGAALLLGLIFLSRAMPAMELTTTRPREAFKDVGEYVNGVDGAILTNSMRPSGLEYYINRSVEVLSLEELERRMCGLEQGPVIVIDHPLFQERPLDTSCLVAAGLDREQFRQVTRGGRIDVWIIPG